MERRKHDQARPFRRSLPDRTPRSLLVGRERELAFLSSRLDAAGRGEGGVVLVSGEPGIGKSRLLLEIQARAHAGGWLVLSGRAYDTEGMPPYLAFAEAIAQYLRMTADDEAGPRLAEAAREVALLVPELGERLPDAGDQPSLGPAAARYRLFEAVSDFFLGLAATSEASGLLLSLDDLHWADRSTLLLFQHLARKVSGACLLVVGAFRTEEVNRSQPLFDVLAELAREQQDQRLTLARLSLDETSALVAGLSGATPAAALVQAIHHQTEGNPFFVQEVVRHLQSQEHGLAGAGPRPEDWGLSEGVREVIVRRLSRLAVETQRLLASAAVLGDGFDTALLRAVDGSEAASVTGALEEATWAAMLREEGSSYVFGHPIIRQVIYEGMSLPRRQELHLRVAEAIETIHAARLDPYLSALATHYRLAGPFADGEKAIDYSVRAGEAAERALAYEEAQVHWEAALELIELHGLKDAVRVSLVERLGELMQVVGFDNYANSARYFEQAIALHEKMGDTAGAAAMHARLGLLLGAGGPVNDNPAALRHLGAAEPLLKDGPASDAQLSLYSGLGLVAVWQVHTEEGLAASTRAMEIALALGSEDRWVTNAVMRSYHLHALGRLGEGVSLMAEAWETAHRLNNTYRAFVAALWLGNRLLDLGDPIEARAWYQREVDQPRQAHAPTRRESLRGSIAATFARTGETETCRRMLADEGIRPSAEITFLDGSWDKAEAIWTKVRQAGPVGLHRSNQATADYWLARVRRLRGDPAGAIDLLTDALAIGLDGPSLLVQLESSAELAIVLAESGRPDESETHLARCREILGNGEDWRGLAGRVALAEAVRAGMAERIEQAEAHLSGAVAIFRRFCLPWDEADALTLRGHFYAHAGRRYHQAALESFDGAGAIYRARSAGEPWTDHVEARKRSLTGRSASGAIYPHGLSERQFQVLRLIAQGKTNREIADKLVLSVRTVQRHVADVYAKIDARNRAEATAFALDRLRNG